MACALRLGPLAMSPTRISDALVLLGRACGTAWLFSLLHCGVGHPLAGGEKVKFAADSKLPHTVFGSPMWVVVALFATGLIAILWIKIGTARRRYCRLVRDCRVRSWTTIIEEPLAFGKIVRTDLGFGREIWAIPHDTVEIDHELRAFKGGILIQPAPRVTELVSFCQSHGLEFNQMAVKWK